MVVIIQLFVIISYSQNISQLRFCCACQLVFYLLECKGRLISILPCKVIIHPKVCLPAQLVTGCAVRNAFNNTALKGKKRNRSVRHAPNIYFVHGSWQSYRSPGKRGEAYGSLNTEFLVYYKKSTYSFLGFPSNIRQAL